MSIEESRKIKILHVDDDSQSLELTKMHFERIGARMELVPYTSSSSALHSFEEQQFDCVISDFHMPELDGLTLLRRLRDIDPNIPFILLSGDDREDVAVTALLSGVDDYFIKGIDGNQYNKIASRILSILSSKYLTSAEYGKLNNKLKSKLDTLASAIFVASRDNRILYGNKKFTKIFGNALNKRCNEIVMKRGIPCMCCPVDEICFESIPRFMESKNGQCELVRLFVHPVCMENGEYGALHMILNGFG